MELFGAKDVAFFDLWSLQHFFSGLLVGWLAMKHNERWYLPTRFDVALVLLASYVWEVTEHYMETGAFGTYVAGSFHAVEFWGNRMVTDPMMMVLGYFVVARYPGTFYLGIIGAVSFLLNRI